MNSQQIMDTAATIIGNRMELDYYNRMAGKLVFRQHRIMITEDEIKDIQRELLINGIYSQLQTTTNEYVLHILAAFPGSKKEKPLVNLALLIATFITTTLTGALFAGHDPFESFSAMFTGAPYAIALMAILGAHEMGHYLYAKRYEISVTLPYFIPFFLPGLNLFGTFGAFIKMRSPIPDKKALFDVGIAGPIAGFVVSLFFLILGFYLLPDADGVRAYVSQIHPWSENGSGALTLGNSILFEFIRQSFGAGYLPMYEAYHFPFIFAGWIGMLVTALNLIPIGQLDGGHISYALVGGKAKYIAGAAFLALALLNFYSLNWLVWTLLIFFLIKLKHPPTLDDTVQLDTNRKILGAISYLIFLTCFSPAPVYFG